jgi:hypothetical protein
MAEQVAVTAEHLFGTSADASNDLDLFLNGCLCLEWTRRPTKPIALTVLLRGVAVTDCAAPQHAKMRLPVKQQTLCPGRVVPVIS